MLKTTIAAAIAGAVLLSMTTANAATRKYESFTNDPPAVSGPMHSDCTIIGRYHDTPYCFGNPHEGYVARASRANLGRSVY